MTNEFYMSEAIKEAKKGALFGEVPIGAVVVKNGQIVGRGHNSRELSESALGHAEINAILQASETLGNWRLTDCAIYVTIEPCPMCVGAIYQSRIKSIFYGAADLKAGACGSVLNLFESKGLNHYCKINHGILELECRELMVSFFKSKRIK